MRDDSSTVNTEAEVPVVDGVRLRRERGDIFSDVWQYSVVMR
jgi:hypothetical protein